MVRAVIFDIGAVLIRFDWESYMEKLFPDAETRAAVTAATWHNADWNELDKGVLTLEEVIALFTENAPDYAAEIRETVLRLGEAPEKQPYAIPWVEELKSAGFQVYFLSNYFEYLIAQAPQVLDFIPHMDGGVFSCREKVTKPDAEIYRRLLERYGLNAEECVFIDDSPKNVLGAEQLGIHAFRFTDYDEIHAAVNAFLSAQK